MGWFLSFWHWGSTVFMERKKENMLVYSANWRNWCATPVQKGFFLSLCISLLIDLMSFYHWFHSIIFCFNRHMHDPLLWAGLTTFVYTHNMFLFFVPLGNTSQFLFVKRPRKINLTLLTRYMRFWLLWGLNTRLWGNYKAPYYQIKKITGRRCYEAFTVAFFYYVITNISVYILCCTTLSSSHTLVQICMNIKRYT